MSDIRQEKIERDMSDPEVLAAGEELARQLGAKTLLEEKRKAAMAVFKGQAEDLDFEISRLGKQIHRRRLVEWIDVEDIRNESYGSIDTVRKDTGEIIRNRHMTPEERQGNLYPIQGRSPEEQDEIDRTPAGS